MPIRIDPRWLRLGLLSAVVAALSCLAGWAWVAIPVNIPIPARDWVGAVLGLSAAVAGFAWVIVKAFDMFDVEGLRENAE